jgi:predicted DNA-binding protein
MTKWKPIFLPPELKARLKGLADKKGQSMPELIEELLRGSLRESLEQYTVCRAKAVDARNMLGFEVKAYYVECQDPSGRKFKALTPDLRDFVAKLKLVVAIEE